MYRTTRVLLVIGLVGAANAPFACAETPVSLEVGYLNTNHERYSYGFVWGASIRGDRSLTLGVSVRWYDNTVNWETDIDVGGEVVTFWYEETFSIFSVSPYVYYNLLKDESINALLIGAGPQVHFVTAEKIFIRERYSQSVRESRLGFGALLHYERRISMFGELHFIAEAYYSYMEGTFEKIDNYQPPLEPVNMTGILVGLGYPL